jgi:hypothetical protein
VGGCHGPCRVLVDIVYTYSVQWCTVWQMQHLAGSNCLHVVYRNHRLCVYIWVCSRLSSSMHMPFASMHAQAVTAACTGRCCRVLLA